jgi:hypothetical protein
MVPLPTCGGALRTSLFEARSERGHKRTGLKSDLQPITTQQPHISLVSEDSVVEGSEGSEGSAETPSGLIQ